MVNTRSRGRGTVKTKQKHEAATSPPSSGGGGNGTGGDTSTTTITTAEYEESRAQRIKENNERLKSLGILDISKNLITKTNTNKKPPRVSSKPPPAAHPPRRSSRVKDLPPVNYAEKNMPKKDKDASPKIVEIHIAEGEKPEVYTDEHEKLLGDSEAAWELQVDGFDEDGQRIYDPHQGKSCHQCRQKTLGRRTACSKCGMISGQFCGDCLYMRYGENVIEVNENPDWVCPVCRGICNCSRCRRDKGWEPTGAIYRKVVYLGFKSVAHYLILTYRDQSVVNVEEGTENSNSISEDAKEESSAALPAPSVAPQNENEEDEMELDGDEEYIVGDDHDDDFETDGENAGQ